MSVPKRLFALNPPQIKGHNISYIIKKKFVLITFIKLRTVFVTKTLFFKNYSKFLIFGNYQFFENSLILTENSSSVV